MALFRQVQTSFWQDGFVLELTPEEKYFYIYLMTNSKTAQCGIYELPKRVIEMDTGYNRETVDKLLQRFIDYGKILYNESTREIMLINWIKFNKLNSPKVKACILKELNEIKHKPFIKMFSTLSIQYGYSIDTLSIDYGEEEEEEEEEEYKNKRKIKEEEQNNKKNEIELSSDTVNNPIHFYENNFGVLNPFIAEDIIKWCEDAGDELVTESMKRALSQNKQWAYAVKILVTWKQRNINSMDAVLADDISFKKRKEQSNGRSSNNSRPNSTGLSTIEEQERFIEENRLPFIKR
ncbi:DNA replication protein DnaD [Bacillus sp. AFS002410]|uniref:DnaD domain-containing protein n=1 Tax=Bacillus sp. AFS002410 TaxID=2033481 RepID=UPI000BEFB41C|nr:DnaD domain protein [Bacillus sp. AFS002410]PEJ46940.1 DNA replication protein DnaD [Bacillus sp. AFS002410]